MPVSQRMPFTHVTYSFTRTENPDQEHFERHCHKFCELLYVVNGAGKYVVEGAEYPLLPNTLLLIRPFEFHYVCPDSNCVYERFVIHFDSQTPFEAAAELSILRNREIQGRGIYVSAPEVTERIGHTLAELEESLHALAETSNATAKQKTFLRASLSQILLKLSLAQPQESSTDPNDVVSRLIAYLNLHLTEDCSLDQLSQRFFVSKYYLCHAFRKQTGVAILSYITAKRIALAQQLLSNGEPATSVAYQVGFSGYSSFYRAYRKQTGEAPTCKRKERTGSM